MAFALPLLPFLLFLFSFPAFLRLLIDEVTTQSRNCAMLYARNYVAAWQNEKIRTEVHRVWDVSVLKMSMRL